LQITPCLKGARTPRPWQGPCKQGYLDEARRDASDSGCKRSPLALPDAAADDKHHVRADSGQLIGKHGAQKRGIAGQVGHSTETVEAGRSSPAETNQCP
jgi:hypothetical protein